jgi:hypothetical protein
MTKRRLSLETHGLGQAPFGLKIGTQLNYYHLLQRA